MCDSREREKAGIFALMRFPVLHLTDAEYDIAYEESERLGVLDHSITGGEGNVVASLGEQSNARYLGIGEREHTYDYDMKHSGYGLDTKTKTTTTDCIKENYNASVADYNLLQQCDIYFFVRVNLEKRIAIMGGWLWKEEFAANAWQLLEGEGEGDNNYITKANCKNILYGNLRPAESLLTGKPIL